LKVLQLIEPGAAPSQLEAHADEILAASSERVVSTHFWTWKLRVPILLAFLIAFFNQLSGINAILYFAPRIFGLTGSESALGQSVGIGFTNLVFTFVGLWLIDRLGTDAFHRIVWLHPLTGTVRGGVHPGCSSRRRVRCGGCQGRRGQSRGANSRASPH
jgi:hypothetical protein